MKQNLVLEKKNEELLREKVHLEDINQVLLAEKAQLELKVEAWEELVRAPIVSTDSPLGPTDWIIPRQVD